MELLANRFVRYDGGDIVDLATAQRVRVVRSSQGGATDQANWAIECARLALLRHPAQPALIDYGVDGETQRFEAWRGIDGPPHDLPSIRLLPRPTLAPLARLLAQPSSSARAVSLWGPPGSGMTTVIEDVARTARLHGIVPVCPAAMTADVRARLRGRTLLLIATGAAQQAWRTWLELSMESGRRHVLLYAGREDVRGTVAIVLERFSAEALAAAVHIETSPMELSGLTAIANAAKGLPAEFAARVWGRGRQSSLGGRSAMADRVAEPRIDYGVGTVPAGIPSPARERPASSDVVPLRARLSEVAALVMRAPRAAAIRDLRQVVGALWRRHDWTSAAEGALTLAQLDLWRGRRQATASIAQAVECAARAGDVRLTLRGAILTGRHTVDQRRLDEAEATLTAARVTARGVADHALLGVASLELARCLFWRGRFSDAQQALAAFDGDIAPADMAARLAACRCRIAIGQQRLVEAVAQARQATSAGRVDGRDALTASICRMHTHLATGDYDAVRSDAADALRLARRWQGLRAALSVRLLLAEAARRDGRRGEALRLVTRLTREKAPRLPPLLAARLHLLGELVKDDDPEVVARVTKATGLGGLVAFAPVAPDPAPPAVVASVLEILRCCQSADDDRRIVDALCAQLKGALRAQAIAAFVADATQLVCLASAGGRVEASHAVRVQTMGDAVGPRPHDVADSHAGVPVRWGGQILGVLSAVWARSDEAAAADWRTLLNAAALAVAPVLAAERMRRMQPHRGVPELLGTSPAMTQVRNLVERAAPAPFSVLIEGESGSGKELVARALHRRSPRRDRACCAVNCAALPDDLLESELFGHARGAFTGAMAERIGVFEEAHGGTLFLDEVGELSPRAQAKLLRAIQEGEIRRVGENAPRRVDVRLVAATNRDLRLEVAGGRFRQDLLYRLDVIRIPLPPLRERLEDIPLLAEQFWRAAAERIGSRATLSVTTLAALARYEWPGNVRELQNVMAALAVRAPRRGVIPPTALPAAFHAMAIAPVWRLEEARKTFEASFVRAALVRAGGHRIRAAEELGVTRQGLSKLMTRLGLSKPLAESQTEYM